MANQTIYLANPTDTAVENVNAAGDDLPAFGFLAAVLSDAEQATLAAAAPKVMIVGQAASHEERQIAAQIITSGGYPGRGDDPASGT